MSPPKALPSRPNLEQLKDQADDLRRAFARRDPDALGRVAAIGAAKPAGPELPVARSLLVIAREYGYPSWTALKESVTHKENAMDTMKDMTDADCPCGRTGPDARYPMDNMKAMTDSDRRELYNFSLRLASFLRLGVPILDGLEAGAQATKDPEFAAALRDIHQKLREGESFAARLQEHPRWFKKVYVQMVAAGQETGQLDVMVEKLAAYIEAGEPASPVAAFARQMATMIGAGLPVEVAVQIIGDQTEDPKLAAALKAVYADLKTGSTIADALAKHPDVFEKAVVLMVKAGEIGGAIDKALDRLATDLERQEAFGKKTPSVVVNVNVPK